MKCKNDMLWNSGYLNAAMSADLRSLSLNNILHFDFCPEQSCNMLISDL